MSPPIRLTSEQEREVLAFDKNARPVSPSGSGRPFRKTMRYNYIASAGDGEVYVLHVAVRLLQDYSPECKVVAFADIAHGRMWQGDIVYRGAAGWCVLWDCEWGWNDFPWTCFGAMTFPWQETVNPAALKGTKYEYCQYADPNPGPGLIDWLSLYRKEPKVELLAKAGMFNLISPSGLAALRDRKVFDWCRKHPKEVEKHQLVDVLYAVRHNVSPWDARNRRIFVETTAPALPHPRRVRYDYDRIRRSLTKWGANVDEYAHYLHLCRELGRDLRNEGTLYPPVSGGRAAFMARTEALERERARIEREQERERRRRDAAARAKQEREMARRHKEIASFQAAVDRSRKLRGCGYAVVLAKTQAELRREGGKMRNCVGCGTYGTGIAKGTLFIVMLRRKGKPYCDIEITRRTWRVRQCYAAGNELPPVEVRELADTIAQVLRQHWKRRKAS